MPDIAFINDHKVPLMPRLASFFFGAKYGVKKLTHFILAITYPSLVKQGFNYLLFRVFKAVVI